jgi:hypothetical protein
MSTEVHDKGPLLQNGEKHKVTIHGAPCGQKAYIQWGPALFPKGMNVQMSNNLANIDIIIL